MPTLDYDRLVFRKCTNPFAEVAKEDLIIYGGFLSREELIDSKGFRDIFPGMRFLGTFKPASAQDILNVIERVKTEALLVRHLDGSHTLLYKPVLNSMHSSPTLQETMAQNIDALCEIHNRNIGAHKVVDKYSGVELIKKEDVPINPTFCGKTPSTSIHKEDVLVPMPCRSTRCIEF